MEKYVTMEELRTATLACERCGLSLCRTNVVFGSGNPQAKVMLVGEGPGEQEDLSGEAFVGRSGQLLDKMLAYVNLYRRDNVYIANMVKCRPPQNRNPTKDEMALCMKWLDNQLQLIKPRIIVCLGRVAASVLIDPAYKVTLQHGQFYEKNGILFMGTFHPAALLRYPSKKPTAMEDLLLLRAKMDEMGLK